MKKRRSGEVRRFAHGGLVVSIDIQIIGSEAAIIKVISALWLIGLGVMKKRRTGGSAAFRPKRHQGTARND